jgi:hypothetical protein
LTRTIITKELILVKLKECPSGCYHPRPSCEQADNGLPISRSTEGDRPPDLMGLFTTI